MKKAENLTQEEAEATAVAALAYLGRHSDRLGRFLALTGLDVASLRQAAGAPGFLSAVLDHIGGYEPDLLAFAQEAGFSPERVAAARQILAAKNTSDGDLSKPGDNA